jgi:hypothetical protein
MSADASDYARQFQAGKRVRVGVPLSGGGVFQEWGVVVALDSDLLQLDLSREYLPEQARLELGRTLELGVQDGRDNLCCRGVVAGTAAGEDPRLALRLIDGFALYEPREFFRQDVYLPLDYRICRRQSRREVRERWRQTKWAMEFAAQKPEPGEAAELEALREEIRTRLARCKEVAAAAANISGGGVRLALQERLRPGNMVELTMYLPQPERVLEIVGEVVQVQALREDTVFSTALRFRFIEEADRDRLIEFVTSEQLRQLSRQAPWQETMAPAAGEKERASRLRLALALLVLVLLLGFEARSIVAGRERGEKHEIALIFEKGIAGILSRR